MLNYITFLEYGRDVERTDKVIPMCKQPINYDDDLRLHNGTDTSGELQIYINNNWRKLCANHFTMTEGQIACRQLGFSTMERIAITQWYVYNNSSLLCLTV